MKTFMLILAMLAAPLAAQSTSSQVSQTKASSAGQQPHTVVKPTVKAVQPHSLPQLITFTSKQLDEYEDKILDRSEAFYNNRMTHLLWVMGILVGIGVLVLPIILEWQRKTSFNKEVETQSRKFKRALAADSAIHYLEHANNLQDHGVNVIDKLRLLLSSAEKFAEAEDINGIQQSLEAIESLQLPTHSMGVDFENQHTSLLSKHSMACNAIRKSGFYETFATRLESIGPKIHNWYRNLPENKNSE